MSSSCNAYIVFGFAAPSDYLSRIGKDDRGRQIYLDEWLEAEGLRPAEQVNAGQTQGGSPYQIVAVTLHRLEDYTRGDAHIQIPPRLLVSPRAERAVREAARKLGVNEEDVGFLLVGEVT